MKTPRNSKYFNGKRTVALPLFLKEHVKRKSNNMSKYIRDLLDDYYQVIEANSLNEDIKKVFISISISNEQQNQLVDMVKISPHISVCDLIRTMLWMDFIKDESLRETKSPYPIPEGFIRVPIEEGFKDYKLIGEA